MKKYLAAFVCIATGGFIGTASAADLPVRMPTKAPPIVAAATWTGCYIGGNAGYGWTHSHWFDFGPYTDEGSNTSSGGAVGLQGGCDYQTGPFVVGIQGMWDWANLDGSHPYTLDPSYTDHSKVSSFATLTGRLGYAVQPDSLAYLKGGAAWVRDKFTETCAPNIFTGCPGIAKVTRSGWTLGGGLEHRFTSNLSAFVEYNYMGFGKKTSTLLYADGSTYDYDIKQNVQTVLAGVNYRFSGPASRY
jgi:outer membrane immunogenic protein